MRATPTLGFDITARDKNIPGLVADGSLLSLAAFVTDLVERLDLKTLSALGTTRSTFGTLLWVLLFAFAGGSAGFQPASAKKAGRNRKIHAADAQFPLAFAGPTCFVRRPRP